MHSAGQCCLPLSYPSAPSEPLCEPTSDRSLVAAVPTAWSSACSSQVPCTHHFYRELLPDPCATAQFLQCTPVTNNSITMSHSYLGSSSSIVSLITRLWVGQSGGRILAWGRDLLSSSEQPDGHRKLPASYLTSKGEFFPWGVKKKKSWCVGQANHLYLLLWLRMSAAIPHTLFIPSQHIKGLYLTLTFTLFLA